MNERERVVVLILVMAMGLLLVTGITIWFLYDAAIDSVRARLAETARSNARLMEAIAREEATNAELHGEEIDQVVLAHVLGAYSEYRGWGETGEFTLARREGDLIVWLLEHRHSQDKDPQPILFDSALAEPMRRALSGQSGSVVGLDYRGAMVVAAYEPVGEVNLGIVAKIDLDEVRAPFWKAGLFAVGFSLLVAVGGAALFLKVSNPLIDELEQRSAMLEHMLKVLSENEERYRTTFELAGVGIAQVSLDGRFIDVNERLCRIVGYGAEEIKDMSFQDITHPDDVATDLEFARQMIAGEIDHYSIDRRYVRKDSSEFWVNLTTSLVRNQDGDPRHFISIVEDITARKTAEKTVKKSLAEKEVLLQEIHHRVKNNMQVISSLLSLQAANIDDRGLRTVFRESQSRVRAMALIHEILYDSGDLSGIDLENYMTRLASSLVRMYRSDAGLIEIDVDCETIALGIDAMVPCGLAISELVSNALKYAFPEGRPGRIEIQAARTSNGDIELVVRDDGVGISPDLDIRSTGTMGMNLVLGLVEKQLGGTIELDRGRGTRFTIIIPKEIALA